MNKIEQPLFELDSYTIKQNLLVSTRYIIEFIIKNKNACNEEFMQILQKYSEGYK